MIYFFLTREHRYTLQEVARSPLAPRTRLLDYDRLFRKSRLPGATYIFSDLDRLGYWDLELAARVHRRLQAAGAKVLNDPARVKMRDALLRALYAAGLN